MKLEIRIPEVGESVQEALLAQWFKKSGDRVLKDEVLFVIETDKVTLEIAAEQEGVLEIVVPEGQTVPVGMVVGFLDLSAGVEPKGTAAPAVPKAAGEKDWPSEAPSAASPVPSELRDSAPVQVGSAVRSSSTMPAPDAMVPPGVRGLAAEKGVDLSEIKGTGPAGRVTKGDVLLAVESAQTEAPSKTLRGTQGPASSEPRLMSSVEPVGEGADREPRTRREEGPGAEERVTRKPMSRIRQRIAEHLLEARRNTAMLTTFNEIDMSRAQQLRARYKEPFLKRYGIGLGFMSFFVKASVQALLEYPEVNAFIDGKDIVYHHYVHIGVAVGSEKGLVVPVIRHADRLSFAQVEQAIADVVKKIAENRLDLSDLEGGTFTISNGGVYGSLLSTPILNSPQSGILGMHKIEDRPVAVGGQVVVRPMMYVALSYDHRIIDGREAVGFLKRIKECVEDPERMLIEI